MRCKNSLSRLIKSRDFIAISIYTLGCSQYLEPKHRTLRDPCHCAFSEGDAEEAVVRYSPSWQQWQLNADHYLWLRSIPESRRLSPALQSLHLPFFLSEENSIS